jgi:hypothetical protein
MSVVLAQSSHESHVDRDGAAIQQTRKILPCKITLDWLTYNKWLTGCNFRPLVLALRLGFDSEALLLLSYSSFALRRLREARESPLWIDAICINQKDNAEKATQIPLMGDIYSQTEQVIIWLGYSEAERAADDEAKEKLAFGLLEDLANNNIFSESGDEVYDKFLEIGMSGESPEKRWSAFHDLFSHPWFTRLWVHQEALLATDCVVFTKYDTIQYPSLIISAGVVQTHLFRLAQTLEPRPFLMEYELLTELLDKTLKRVQWRAWPTIQKMQQEAGTMNSSNKLVETRSLLRDLRATTFFDCYDPRDRVYGILGIAKHSNQIKEWIKVDYSHSVLQVYTDVARVIIESDNSLDSICGAGRTGSEIREQEEFPSWVIDWRIRIDIERQLRPYLYSTAAGTKPQSAFTNGGRGLDIKGLSVALF